MPKVSAIIPAYNGATRYLEQAIRSALAQSWRDLDVIVVDDASTDDTARVVLQFPRVRYFRRPTNGGQAVARNDGARLAHGELLAFLDQDDLWEPDFIETCLAALNGNPEAAVIHADGYQISENDGILEYDAAMKDHFTVTQILRGNHDVATSGSIFRKTCFDAVGGYDPALTIWEDIDLAIRIYQRFPIMHVAKPLYRHRLYSRNASRDIPSDRALVARKYFLEKHGPSCRESSREGRALVRDWAHYYSDLGKSSLRQGRIPDARRAFAAAVKLMPFDHKGLLRLLRSYLVRKTSVKPAPSSRGR